MVELKNSGNILAYHYYFDKLGLKLMYGVEAYVFPYRGNIYIDNI